jgi:hypothetical protein
MALANITNNILTDTGVLVSSLQPLLTNPVTGTGTTNYLPKFTGASTIGNSVIQEASGNIGIGVSPTTTLDVNGTGRFGSAATKLTTYSDAVYSGIFNGASLGSAESVYMGDSKVFFIAAGSERMRLTQSGLGIGTTSPVRNLTVQSTTDTYISVNGGATSDVGYLFGQSTSDAVGRIIYVNGSNNMQFWTNSAERMRLNASGNLGLGVTPSAWSQFTALQLGGNTYSAIASSNNYIIVSANAVYDGSDFKYISTSAASRYQQSGGGHEWHTAPSGTAGNAISFTQAMTLNASGNLSIGNTNDTFKLDVTGTGRFTGTSLILGSNANGNTQLTINSTTGTAQRIAFQVAGTDQWLIGNGAASQTTNFEIYNTAGTIVYSVNRTTNAATFTGAATFSSSVTATTYTSLSSTPQMDFVLNVNTAFKHSIVASGFSSSPASLNTLDFRVANGANSQVTVMTMNGAGNVGIGTASPAYRLEVNNSTGDNHIAAVGTAPSLNLMTTNTGGANWGTVGMATATNNFIVGAVAGDLIMLNRGSTAGNILFGFGSSESMRIRSNGNIGIGTTGSSTIRLITAGSGTSSAASSFVAADSGGNTLFGVRNDGLLSTGQATLSPFNFTTGTAANLVVDSSGFLYRSSSSLKYKTNVRDYDKGLDIINQMRPVYYNGKNDGKTQFAGLIAEEIHDLGLTEFVQYAKDGTPDALSYPNMVALLVKGMKEQQAQIEELKSQIK